MMRNKLIYIICLLLVACQKEELDVTVPRDDFSVVPVESERVKGEIHVKFKTLQEDLQAVATPDGFQVEGEELTSAMRKIGAKSLERVFPYAGKFEARTRKEGLHLWYRVVYDESVDSKEVERVLSELPDVATVEPIFIPESDAVEFPYNDPYFEKQWYLYNSGADDGMIAGADINILEAWKIEKGKPEVIVNVADAQVDIRHMELVNNLWRNPGEYNQNPYMDNDGNGYSGDWFGINSNPYTIQPSAHGTHVAGIIAAKNNNNWGICGIAGGDTPDNGVRIMCCPIGAASIKYGADHGAVISTNSWHVDVNTSTQKVLQEAIDYFVKYAGVDENGEQTGPMKGGLVFASAGNGGVEPKAYYPGSLNHVIAVAALGADFKKASYSNYASWVDIAAPGGSDAATIFSLTMDQGYMEAVGTSQATPVVAAVAALIVSKFGGPGLTPREVEHRLLRGCRPIDEYNPKYVGKLGMGCVDALAALSDKAVNYWPELTLETPVAEPLIVAYGEEMTFVYTVNDPEDGADVNYMVEDPSGAFTHRKEGNKIILTLLNRDCVPGDHVLRLTVTDKGEEPASTSATISFKLHPEFLSEVVVPGSVTDVLTIRASKTFSGNVAVKLYDMNGNLVLEDHVDISLSRAGEVDLSGVDGGNYILKLTCNNKTITKNIIKL